MRHEIDRRRWMGRIAKSTAAWGATSLLPAVDYKKPVPEAEGLTAEQSNGLMIFRWNNRAIGCYRALSSQKYPYFYPLAGPATGLSLLAESALPYPHHRGLWLGCQPLNGGDYWGDTSLDQGQIRTTKLELARQRRSPPSSPIIASGSGRMSLRR